MEFAVGLTCVFGAAVACSCRGMSAADAVSSSESLVTPQEIKTALLAGPREHDRAKADCCGRAA